MSKEHLRWWLEKWTERRDDDPDSGPIEVVRLMKTVLDSQERPRSMAFPGTESMIRSHCESDKTVRTEIASLQKTVLNHGTALLGIRFIVHRA